MSDPAQNQNIITTTSQVHDDHVQNITQNLNQAGHSVTANDVKPPTDQTVIPTASQLMNMGSQILNSEDLQTGIKDLEYIAEADLKKGDKIRVTESKNPLKMLLGKLMRKKSENEEIIEK